MRAEIRRHIEAELMEEWKNGIRSLYDISRLLEALVRALEERLQNVEATHIVRAKENEESAEQRVKANLAERTQK